MKKILSASLAMTMLLATATTAYAADPIPRIDPYGIVYEMGDDNTLILSDGYINHGESFYMLLVDETTGDPRELKSDDLRNLRIYADWKVGEGRVSDEDILYKKAENVIVDYSVVPTYHLRLTLDFPAEGAVDMMVNITKADGTGYTPEEIAALTDEDIKNIVSEYLADYKSNNSTGYYAKILGEEYQNYAGTYLYGDKVYEDEYEFLTSEGLKDASTEGITYLAFPKEGPLEYYVNEDAKSTFLRDSRYGGYTESSIYSYTDGAGTVHYYNTEAAAKAAVFSDTSVNTQILPTGGADAGRVLDSDSKFYQGYRLAEVGSVIRKNRYNDLFFIADSIGANPTMDSIPTSGYMSAKLVVESGNFKIWRPESVIYSDYNMDDGEDYKISNLSTKAIAGYAPFSPNTPDVKAVFQRIDENDVKYLSSGDFSATPIDGITKDELYIAGTSTAPAADSYYNTADNTYYADKAAAIVASEITEHRNAFYKNNNVNVDANGKISEYITDSSTLFGDTMPADTYVDEDEGGNVIPASAVANYTESADLVWRKESDKTFMTDAAIEAIATANEANVVVVGAPTLGSLVQPVTRAVTGTTMLEGSDYYYFVQVETMGYTGAESYDVAGSVSVGTSTNNAADRGSAEVVMTLTAGNYDSGTAQDGDIDIYGESGAVVEFEDNAGEIAIFWDDDAMFMVDVSGQGDLNLGYNTDFDSTFADRHGYANIDFLNFVDAPKFNRSGDLYIYASEDMYIYALNENGYAEEISGLEYDEGEEAWTFRTNHLTNYVISDEELVLTDEQGNITEPEDAQPSPTITSHIDGKVNPATGR